MKTSTKAALVSALVFPGVGHFLLKRGARGCLFLVPAALAVATILRRTLQLADTLLDQINSGALPLDPALISERIAAAGGDGMAVNLASLVCLACWIGAIADTIWIGRKTGK